MNLLTVLLTLAVVQGIAEFLPISSSGHLVIFQSIPQFSAFIENLGEDINLFVNVALHVATLLAVLILLRKDIVDIIAGFFRGLRTRDFTDPGFRSALNILVASVPAGAIGIALNDAFESIYGIVTLTLILLIINGIALILTKKIPLKSRQISEIGLFRSFVVGLFQALAILPGISRSGMTIAGGMLAGLAPLESARFSFLMAVPVIAGAGLMEGIKAAQGSVKPEIFLPLGISFAVATLVAVFAIKLLLAAVKRVRLDIFGYYTIAAGVCGLAIIHLVK